jgi:hypothetical protein
MKTFALLVALALVCAAATSAASGRDPRSERLRLNRHDTALAKRIRLRPRDLEPGWREIPVTKPPTSSSGCRRFRPDLSRFRITGAAGSQFVAADGSGSGLSSAVGVFATERESVADFRISAKPGLRHCVGQTFMSQIRKGVHGLAKVRLVAARVLQLPRVGDRSIAYRIVVELRVRNRRARIHGDVFAIQRGRAQASLVLVWVRGRSRLEMTYARELAFKMRLAD